MSSGEFGGGGSVKWKVDIDKACPKSFKTVHDHISRSFRQEGVDDTPPRIDFRVVIRVPKSPAARARLEEELRQAIGRKGQFTLTLPVEYNPRQIRVSWPSKKKR
jgi:hypothetical protein